MSWKPKFAEICKMTHTEQAIWWLNGFWTEGAEEYKEDMWTIVHQFLEVQLGRPVLYGRKTQEYEEACDLDELQSHRILEVMGETMTVLALRKRLKELDIDNNKRMCISEYLLDKYKKTPEELCKAPQGDVDPAELALAQEACEKASDALAKASAEAEAAATALKASQEAAAAAATAKEEAEAAQKQAEEAEAKVRAAEAELQAAVDEIEALEKAKADKVAKFQKIIDDPDMGAVKKGRAVQEKEAILAEDPLPLRKAKITQGAALKKVQKARDKAVEETKKATDAAEAAAKAKGEADQAEKDSAAAKEAADAAKEAADAALAAAQKALDDLKAKGGGSPMGKLWWMERVLQEKSKFT